MQRCRFPSSFYTKRNTADAAEIYKRKYNINKKLGCLCAQWSWVHGTRVTLLLHPFETSICRGHLILVVIAHCKYKVRLCVCFQNLGFCTGQIGETILNSYVRWDLHTPQYRHRCLFRCSIGFWLSNVFCPTVKANVPQSNYHQFTLSRKL